MRINSGTRVPGEECRRRPEPINCLSCDGLLSLRLDSISMQLCMKGAGGEHTPHTQRQAEGFALSASFPAL